LGYGKSDDCPLGRDICKGENGSGYYGKEKEMNSTLNGIYNLGNLQN
jgi:hypothetical protein